MRLFFLGIIFLIFLSTSLDGQCYNGGYSPGFEPFANITSFPLQQCKLIESPTCEKASFKCKLSDNRSLIFNITSNDNSTELSTEYQISNSGGDTCMGKSEYRRYCTALDEVEVYIGDLNLDKVPDIIAVLPSSGFGLSSEYCSVVFCLSSQKTYNFIGMLTMGFGPEDAIDFFRDGRCQIVHSSFVHGGPGKDGKNHGYWVYNFFEVDGAEIKLSKKMAQRWIMFAGKSNHIPTRQLSQEQQKNLWDNHPDFFFKINKQ